MASVYELWCSANNKRYIGSSKNWVRRTEQHLNELRLGKHFCYKMQEDFNNWGEVSFYKRELASFLDRGVCQALEYAIIRANDIELLYNQNIFETELLQAKVLLSTKL